MATVTMNRSDRYPPATVVKVWPGFANRHFAGKPSGTAAAEGTVASDGKLSITVAEDGTYLAYAEVAGVDRTTVCSTGPAFPEYQTLQERIVARQAEVGA